MNDEKLTIFNLRINKKLKDEFIQITKENNVNASQMIRKYIKNYVNNKKKSNGE